MTQSHFIKFNVPSRLLVGRATKPWSTKTKVLKLQCMMISNISQKLALTTHNIIEMHNWLKYSYFDSRKDDPSATLCAPLPNGPKLFRSWYWINYWKIQHKTQICQFIPSKSLRIFNIRCQLYYKTCVSQYQNKSTINL